METIINEMKSLGLTEYEVKAYLTLLQEHPLNGYGLSKQSGIPRSRIYEVLHSLKDKQVIFEHIENKTTTYTPLEPALLLNKLKKNFETTIKSIEDYTHSLYTSGPLDMTPKVLKGRMEILNMIQILISSAKTRIALSIWDEELLEIKTQLDQAQSKGIMIKGVYFGDDQPYNGLISHRRIERYVAEKEERNIIIVIDSTHVISGIISRDEEARVTWSQDPGIVDINDDFIAHDVMINVYSQQLPILDRALYEHTLDGVRKDYYGFSDEEFKLFPLPKDN